jgi:hypothetical protein
MTLRRFAGGINGLTYKRSHVCLACAGQFRNGRATIGGVVHRVNHLREAVAKATQQNADPQPVILKIAAGS